MNDGLLPKIHELVEDGKLEELQTYLKNLTPTELAHEINESDDVYETPLHIAFGRKNAADKNATDILKHPVFSGSQQDMLADDIKNISNYSAIIDLLLQYGANPYHLTEVPAEDIKRRPPSAIHMVVKEHQHEIEELYKKYAKARGEEVEIPELAANFADKFAKPSKIEPFID